MSYKNGFVPANLLVTVAGKQIHRDLAPQLIALRAAYQAEFGVPLLITSAYRPYADQVYWRNRYLAGTGNYAVPAGTSNHGWATAIDFGGPVASIGTKQHSWMVANAPRFGFVWLRKAGNGSIEPWHFDGQYVPSSNYSGGGASAPIAKPAPVIEELESEEDIVVKDNIIALYIYVLRRLPDVAGLAGWIVDMRYGRETYESIEAKLRASDENLTMTAQERDRRTQALSGERPW